MSDYSALREAITKLIDHPLEEWRITRLSAENCLEQLDKYEAEGRPSPKIFIEGQGPTLTWSEGNWRIYQHFLADTKESEFYCFWRKIG